jgi:ubiquinone/menaquinone biosynthesis C-methylase UbiE
MSYQKSNFEKKTKANSKSTFVSKSTDWGKVASWYDKMISDNDSYQNKVILPKLINALNIQKDDIILDLGCGVGYFCQKYFEIGCKKVVGVDLGVESIKLAKQKTNSAIEYFVNTAESLPFLKDESVDKITIILALQNIHKADKCLKECSRVLKSNGKLFVVLNHLYFRVPKNSYWIWSEKESIQYRRVDKYLSHFDVKIDMEPSKKSKSEATISFHRPLEWYIQTAVKSSLYLSDMQEWISHRKTDQGPVKTPKLEISRKEIPLFMMLVFGKINSK